MDLEAQLARRDRYALVAELPDDIERLAHRLLEREPQLVLRDGALDLRTHVRRRFEESICRHQAIERLMRPLEVVVGQEVRQPILGIHRVCEHRPAQKLIPQGLPESLHLAERLRMLRSAPDVLDAHPLQHLLELGLAAPHRVLPAVVGQHLRRLPVRGNASLERLHHQRRFLVVCKRVPHHEPAVVVHEHAHVQPLRPPQPEREDVRLPQLVRRRSLEASRRVLALHLRSRCLDESFVVQNPTHDLLRDSQRFEPCQYVADSPTAPLLVLLLQLHHLVPLHRVRPLPIPIRRCPPRLQSFRTAFPKCLHPFRHRRLRDAERLRDVLLPRSAKSFLNRGQLVLDRVLHPV